jgi:sulfite exporter TauE/SafE
MDLPILLSTAFTIGFIHTLIGPDHYLPFLLIGRARKWTLNRTIWLTIICGLGHVLSSVVLGLIGVALGVAVGLLEKVETVRGSLASWLLIGFGLAYMVWGIKVSIRSKEHSHEHSHDGVRHSHSHHHLGSHFHIHDATESTTPWALFIIFVLGPCEPLIPILMYPAAQHNWGALFWVTLVFGITTITTMTVIVGLAFKGLLMINLGRAERYVHALAGLVIALSGLSLKLFGL